jgi:hypothetical protein
MNPAWVDINDGTDRRRDFEGGLYALAGPEPRGWSWSLQLRGEFEMLAWGRAIDEAGAKEAAERAAEKTA